MRRNHPTSSPGAKSSTKIKVEGSGRRLKLAGRRTKSSVTSVFVRALARRERVVFESTYADQWADAVTQLSGDDVKSDKTDNLLVALNRAGKISGGQFLKLLTSHHRSVRDAF